MSKNLKKGLTLAEMLVALAITGVIAAFAIPVLNSGVQKKQHAIALGKNIQVIETGCNKIIQHANSLSTDGGFLGHYNINKALDGTAIASDSDSITGGNLFNKTGSFFDTSLTLNNNSLKAYTDAVKGYKGNTASPAVSQFVATGIYSNSRTGAYYGAKGVTEAAVSQDPIVEFVYIDVNGDNSPNRYGRDVFVVGLTDACHAIPAGTDRIHALDNNIMTEKTGCKTNDVKDGLSCTSRVIKEGFNINY